MITYGIYTPVSGVPIQIYGVGQAIKYIRILNNSPYQQAVNLGGPVVNVSEFWQKDIPVPPYFQNNVTITPSIAIQTSSHAQAYQLTVQGLVDADGGGTLDSAIPQQAVTATASGSPIYTAQFGLGASAGNVQTLNIFNPANSGAIGTFHAAKVFSNSPGVPQAVMTFIAGADLNLPTAVNANSHSATANPPASLFHCTALDGAGQGGTTIETGRVTGSTSNETTDLLAFPDVVLLYPGTNLLIVCSDTQNNHTIQLAGKWTENVVIPPILIAGGVAVASQIDNSTVSPLAPVGTNLIKSVVPGPLTPVSVTNDGVGFWDVIQSGVLHQVLKFNSAGNPLQLGKSGDITEVLGQFNVDGVSSLDNATIISTGSGDFSTFGSAGTSHAGSVSGTAIMYTPIWGQGLKVLIIVFHNYQSGSAFTFALPSSISNGVFISGNFGAETVAFQLNGVGVNSSVITVLNQAGGTSAGVAAISKNSFGTLADSAVNQALISANAAAVGQALVLVGI